MNSAGSEWVRMHSDETVAKAYQVRMARTGSESESEPFAPDMGPSPNEVRMLLVAWTQKVGSDSDHPPP